MPRTAMFQSLANRSLRIGLLPCLAISSHPLAAENRTLAPLIYPRAIRLNPPKHPIKQNASQLN